jgi:hypothetical protein
MGMSVGFLQRRPRSEFNDRRVISDLISPLIAGAREGTRHRPARRIPGGVRVSLSRPLTRRLAVNSKIVPDYSAGQVSRRALRPNVTGVDAEYVAQDGQREFPRLAVAVARSVADWAVLIHQPGPAAHQPVGDDWSGGADQDVTMHLASSLVPDPHITRLLAPSLERLLHDRRIIIGQTPTK